jgi:hypothetical protein
LTSFPYLNRKHLTAAKALRRERVGVLRPADEPEVEQRALSDCDAALGLDTDDAEGGVGLMAAARRAQRLRRQLGTSPPRSPT